MPMAKRRHAFAAFFSSWTICHTSLDELRKFQLNLERICRQLSALGEDIESKKVFLPHEGKLTRNILRDMRVEKKKAGDNWDTSRFREVLKNLLEEELEISSVMKKARPEPKKKELPK